MIDTIQEIVDSEDLSTTNSKELGQRLFGYLKKDISGPESLMERILTDFGKNTFLGSPVLINTNKYVISEQDESKSQFDILLLNQFNDVEVVELKRPDEFIMDYDENRNKFYASKSLSIAISQAERYLSAIVRDNDDEYLMGGVTIREFLNNLVGGSTTIDVICPRAIIIIGRSQSLTKPYEKISNKKKLRILENDYYGNAERAYRELKSAYRNIQLLTYTELIEGARLRLFESE